MCNWLHKGFVLIWSVLFLHFPTSHELLAENGDDEHSLNSFEYLAVKILHTGTDSPSKISDQRNTLALHPGDPDVKFPELAVLTWFTKDPKVVRKDIP